MLNEDLAVEYERKKESENQNVAVVAFSLKMMLVTVTGRPVGERVVVGSQVLL